MGEFYRHPETGKLHFRAAAGGGNSVYDGVASDTDIKANSDDYGRYLASIRRDEEAATRAAAEQSELEQLRAENATLRAEMERVQEAIKPAPLTEPETHDDHQG